MAVRWWSLPKWLTLPEPGVSRFLEETKAFIHASALHLRRQILALLAVRGICLSGGIALLLKLLDDPDVP